MTESETKSDTESETNSWTIPETEAETVELDHGSVKDIVVGDRGQGPAGYKAI